MRSTRTRLTFRLVFAGALCLSLLIPPTPPALAQATTIVQNEIIPFEQVFPDVDFCNTEPVLLTGAFHVVTTITEDNRNESFLFGGVHFRTVTNLISIDGVGLVTGEQYRLVGAGARIVQELGNDNVTFPIVNSQTSTVNLVSRGSTDNFLVHLTMHTTINANGKVTSVVDNFRIECRG